MNFETYGIDLNEVMLQAYEHGNVEFAKLLEKSIKNLQSCYDVVSEKYTATEGKDLWNIDSKYLESKMI